MRGGAEGWTVPDYATSTVYKYCKHLYKYCKHLYKYCKHLY